MRLSELCRKEIIEMNNGEKMGSIAHSDLEINPATGEIHSILLPLSSSFWRFSKKKTDLVIPWKSIYKIGPEMIIVALHPSQNVIAERE
ncbi:UNVERIFIED_CONTAM: YlmC/YmxH family sporulation protein [Brevibacillus sp. OAP136]